MLFNNSLRGSKYKTQNENFDYKKHLLEQKKINKEFLNRIKLLTIEEVLYLKLDSIATSLKGKLFGFPIYKLLPDICKEAIILYALTSTKNKREAANILNINIRRNYRSGSRNSINNQIIERGQREKIKNKYAINILSKTT